MEVIKFDTAREIEYFDLFDFVKKIKLSSYVLERMEETNKNFDDYFKKLSTFDDRFVLYFFISLARDEINNNQKVENHKIGDFDFKIANLFFDSLDISHKRIHEIHKFVMKDDDNKEKIGVYRKTPVRVSKIDGDKEEIYWYGVNEDDIDKFMDTFIEIYKSKHSSVIDSNPFIKSSLIHLLLAKIQPYFDGNRRTARTLQNVKFTEMINKIYDMDLKISPVNLSESISLNILSYYRVLNNTSFDLESDNEDIINYWFNFMLNLYDEQLFKNQNMIDNMDSHVEKILKIKDLTDPEIIKQIENMDEDSSKVVEVYDKMPFLDKEQVANMRIRKK